MYGNQAKNVQKNINRRKILIISLIIGIILFVVILAFAIPLVVLFKCKILDKS
jgi:hypothetical protein